MSYFAPVQQVGPATHNGPLFDLRAEADGVHGAGITFLVLPKPDTEFAISVRWNCTEEKVRCVASFGEDACELTGTVDMLAYSFYMAGPLHQHPAQGSPTFNMYWLTEPSFDPVAVAEHIERVYSIMCDFFREPVPGHRVFVRRNPHDGTGGTALPRSFFFGYGDDEVPTVESLSALLAHETAHNWPRLDGEHSETAWYSEGTAEYYSLVLPHRAGLLDDEQFLEPVNERARNYFTNPLQTLTSATAAEIYWRDQRAQRVPYGRGLFYLIDVNAKIQAAGEGKRGVDDLVLAALERRWAGEKVGVAEWLEMVRKELGEAGPDDFAAMEAGEWVVPASDALGEPRGAAVRSYRWQVTDRTQRS
ncbi:M61 family metallopeptidase [Streptomyces odonnellii]|uniref:M61 family metallopeptidase n=1 Tax=Streptomyces odonnellii TaxID=1417980 RepID=UPI000624FE85|nr:hypothetical protein [Streptomyces odonnellii]